MSRLQRIGVAARVFCLAAVVTLAVATGNLYGLQAVLLLVAVGATAETLARITPLPSAHVAVGEAVLVAMVVGLSLPEAVTLLPYLVVPALVAGTFRGITAVVVVLLAEATSFGVITLATPAGVRVEMWQTLGPWLVTALGVGLLGSLLREMGLLPTTTATTDSYEAARRLLSQLRLVTRRLSSGLDPVSTADHLLTLVQERLNSTGGAVLVRGDGGSLTPLAERHLDWAATLEDARAAVEACWVEMTPQQATLASDDPTLRHITVLPLRGGSRMVGVLLSSVRALPPPQVVAQTMQLADDFTLRIETGLAFDEIRALATTEERKRLAREIHDGIAQEVASMGYLVDDIAAHAPDPEQRARLEELRGELSRVVGDLRLSIFDLRSEVTSAGLGAALSDYVHQVGARSEMTVHLSLDESPARLRPDVEAELLRIAQEAITNARKHSGARNLWVTCTVQPPWAELVVSDDGQGRRRAGEDSYGLRIMRERAERIDAALAVTDREPSDERRRGTVVCVTVGSLKPSEMSEVS